MDRVHPFLPKTSVYLIRLSLIATKMHAIVAGQTSVKAPEKAAFEQFLPEDVHIVSCHSLHGPTVSPVGQPLVCTIWIRSRGNGSCTAGDH